MKYYIGTKIIQAEPQEKDGQEGYKVKYLDGYESWSPKDVFEEAYSVFGSEMTFAEALFLLRQEPNSVAHRKVWGGKQVITVGIVHGRDVLVLHTYGEQEKMYLNFTVGNTDLLAEDWNVEIPQIQQA